MSEETEDDQISICSGGIFSDQLSIVTQSDVGEGEKPVATRPKVDLTLIRNKQKRSALYQKLKKETRKEKKKQRKQRKLLREKLGDDAPPLQPPKTIENQREKDDTMVHPEDQEVLLDEDTDEMEGYFKLKQTPKVLLTTSEKPTGIVGRFLKEFNATLPNSFMYRRKYLAIKKIVAQCIEKNFTDIIVVNEDRGIPNGMLLCHLPHGPTAHFKVSNVKLRRQIKNSTTPTSHKPEIILNNFNTRLGHTIGRMLAALYPHEPQFRGRQVATYHNQRDFVFFRHHRYIFRNEKRVGLQEIGPRFTLKLRSLQKGTFDSKYGEYDWIHKRHEMDTSRRRFHL